MKTIIDTHKIETLLLTHQEMDQKYQELGKTGLPYCYEIKNSNQVLYFFGAKHINNPEDSQFEVIKKYFNQFTQETYNKNCLAVVEGNGNVLKQTEEEAKKYGEALFTTFIAHQHGIETISPEPEQLQEITMLLNSFTKEEIMYHYFARLVNYWFSFYPKPDLKEFIEERYMKKYKRDLSWYDFDFSFEHFVRLHDHYKNHPFDSDNRSCFYDDSNPSTSKIASLLSHFRDTKIVREILNQWCQDKNIFVVYGSGHAIVQEKALKTLLK